MGLGLGISVDWASLVPYYAQVASAFKARVEADGGTVESMSCLKADLKVLNPIKPPAYTGLLNDYSGAAAAYSLRLLDNTYSGNAIKVRRASDNAEQDIAFSNNELDTASLETFASGTDAFVTTWYDQSGNANNATQTTAANQPKIVSSGSTILENGKAAVDFDGSNDFLQSVSNIGILGNSSRSLYVVEKPNDNANKTILQYGGLGGGQFHNFTQEFGIRVSSGANLFELIKTNQTLLELTFPNGSSVLDDFELYIDSQVATQTSNSVPTRLINTVDSQVTIGTYATAYSSMNLQEIIIYPSDESSNRTGIETNINDFYSIY
jgi:hypothetical protein